MRQPDQPLVYVNAAFEELAGFPAAEVLGRNCRFLQSPDTDPAAVARIRAAIDRGEECRETVLNLRGPDRTPWWNEIHLRRWSTPPARSSSTSASSTTSPPASRPSGPCCRSATATGVPRPHRGAGLHRPADRPAEPAPAARSRSRRRSGGPRPGRTPWRCCSSTSTASRRSTTALGHAAGDELLQSVARTLRGRLRRSDLLARLGGDEFLVALTGLDPATAAAEAARVADELAAAVRAPVGLRGRRGGGRRERGRRGLPGGRRGVRGAAARRRPRHVRAEGRGPEPRAERQGASAPSSSSTGNGGRPTPVSRVLPHASVSVASARAVAVRRGDHERRARRRARRPPGRTRPRARPAGRSGRPARPGRCAAPRRPRSR